MHETTAVYYFPSDGSRLAVVGPASLARNIIMHERSDCDDCGKRRYGIRPYYTDDPVNDKPVMLALCMRCASKIDKARQSIKE